MKITRIRLKNYRGLEALDVAVPPAGVIARGGNARGKTTFLKAIKSALEASDVGSDAIRLGTKRADILVDFDDMTVKRAITEKASTLTVERGGMAPKKPTAFLRELLGGTSLDPLELYLAKPKERRALILAALPCTVTREQLKKYAPDLEDGFDTSGHGLEVVERARKFYYDERTAVNREVDDAKRTAERLEAEATTAAAAVSAGPVFLIEDARQHLAAAERELAMLESRKAEAEASEKRVAGQRDRIVSLREEAEVAAKTAGEMIDTTELDDLVEEASDAVRVLEELLASSRVALAQLKDRLAEANAANERCSRSAARAADLKTQADAIATTIAAATSTPPAEEEIVTARKKIAEAKAAVERAAQQAEALAKVEAAEAAKKTAVSLASEADELDATVKRLANDAPSDLLAAAKGIPGLSLAGDEVLLEGKSLDALSGAEQLKFAVEIARRANTKTKILVCDGLERLDTEQLEAFVAHATRGDWQLLGTLVTGGELVFAAIEPEATSAAAE